MDHEFRATLEQVFLVRETGQKDGNTLYEALCQCLPDVMTVTEVREQLHDHIMENRNMFGSLIVGETYKEKMKNLLNMLDDGVEGGELQLRAASSLFGFRIVIFKPPNSMQIYVSKDYSKTILLSYHDEKYYCRLEMNFDFPSNAMDMDNGAIEWLLISYQSQSGAVPVIDVQFDVQDNCEAMDLDNHDFIVCTAVGSNEKETVISGLKDMDVESTLGNCADLDKDRHVADTIEKVSILILVPKPQVVSQLPLTLSEAVNVTKPRELLLLVDYLNGGVLEQLRMDVGMSKEYWIYKKDHFSPMGLSKTQRSLWVAEMIVTPVLFTVLNISFDGILFKTLIKIGNDDLPRYILDKLWDTVGEDIKDHMNGIIGDKVNILCKHCHIDCPGYGWHFHWDSTRFVRVDFAEGAADYSFMNRFNVFDCDSPPEGIFTRLRAIYDNSYDSITEAVEALYQALDGNVQ